MEYITNGKYAIKTSANNYREVLIESAAMVNGEVVYNGNMSISIADVYSICDDGSIGNPITNNKLDYISWASREDITGWAMTTDGPIRATWKLYNAANLRETDNREYIAMVDEKQYVVKGDNIYRDKIYAEESCSTTITRLDGSVTERKGLLQLIQLTDEQQALVDEYRALCNKMDKANIKHLLDTSYNQEAFINVADVQESMEEDWKECDIAINTYFANHLFQYNNSLQFCHDDYALVVGRK